MITWSRGSTRSAATSRPRTSTDLRGDVDVCVKLRRAGRLPAAALRVAGVLCRPPGSARAPGCIVRPPHAAPILCRPVLPRRAGSRRRWRRRRPHASGERGSPHRPSGLPPSLLDEAGNHRMALAAGGLGEGRVGDLADQPVLEGQLLVASDARGRAVADQAATLERVQCLHESAVVSERLERALPEEVADHGRRRGSPVARAPGAGRAGPR